MVSANVTAFGKPPSSSQMAPWLKCGERKCKLPGDAGACAGAGAGVFREVDVVLEKDRACSILVPKRAELALSKDEEAILVEIAFATQCRIALSEPGCFFLGTGCRVATAHGMPWDVQRCVALLVGRFWDLCQLSSSPPEAVATTTIIVPEPYVRRIRGRSGRLLTQLTQSTRCLICISDAAEGMLERAVSVTGKPADMAKAARVICRRILPENPAEVMVEHTSAAMPFEAAPAVTALLSPTIASLALEPASPKMATASPPPTSFTRLTCSHCSEQVRSDFRFCPNCGASFDEDGGVQSRKSTQTHLQINSVAAH